MASKEEIKSCWAEKKEKLKEKFAMLTKSDLILEDGKKDLMLSKLQIKLGKTKEELLAILSSL